MWSNVTSCILYIFSTSQRYYQMVVSAQLQKHPQKILDVIDQTPILRPYQPVTKISWIFLERSVFLTYSREQYQILQCQIWWEETPHWGLTIFWIFSKTNSARTPNFWTSFSGHTDKMTWSRTSWSYIKYNRNHKLAIPDYSCIIPRNK